MSGDTKTDEAEVVQDPEEGDSPTDLSLSPEEKEARRQFHTYVRKEKLSKSEVMHQFQSCSVCLLVFRDLTLYHLHSMIHSLSPLNCALCGQKTADRVELAKHLIQEPHFQENSS